MQNPYIKQYPDLMDGKKIMYIHGFMSSAQSGTVSILQTLLPNATVVADDIPLDPVEAVTMLQEMARRENPDLIIGTSMGGMYAEMLHGYDRILVNPALEMGQTMQKSNMMGKQVFQNPRRDGVRPSCRSSIHLITGIRYLCTTFSISRCSPWKRIA